MESTPKSTPARYIGHGCQKHTKLRHRPLQFVQDYKSGQPSLHSNTSLTSLFEESSLCSSLGEVDTSWFDSERWTSNEETQWKREEDILKTPQASQRESKIYSTPGLFTPDGLSPVARRQKDYPECHPPPDEDATPSFAQPKRFRKVPSSILTTPNSQIITSHQPTSDPTTATISEEEQDDDEEEAGELRGDPPAEVQFSPFPTWDPTHHKDTPIFMKQLFKTPSMLFGVGDKRACSTPLQRLSTPQRLSRSLGAEPEESDLSWTSSLATPPMSSKGCKTVTSSTKKGSEEDLWQTHVVAKVLFKDGGSVVEMDSCEEEEGGLTQPLQVIKLPSITDDSQEEEFTVETEDGGASDKSVAERSKAVSLVGDEQCAHFDVSACTKLVDNHKNYPAANRTVTNGIPPSTSVQSPMTDHGMPHLAKQESVNKHKPEKEPINQYSDEASVKEINAAVQDGVDLGMNSAAELKSRLTMSRECSNNRPSLNVASEAQDNSNSHPPIPSTMPPQETSIVGSHLASQTLFNSQESTKNEKTAIEETLAFLLATPPSRRDKVLNSLGATDGSVGDSINIGQAALDGVSSTLDAKCDSPATSTCRKLRKGNSDNTLISPPAGLLRKPSKSGHPYGELNRNPMDSECNVDTKANGRLSETPNRPAPDVDLLSPISPNFAEALCRATDNASTEQLHSDSTTILAVQESLGVERNLNSDFDNPDTTRSQIKVLDRSRPGHRTNISVKKNLHPIWKTGQNAITEHCCTSITSNLPISANQQLPKHLLSFKQETNPAMPSAINNFNTQTTTKGRFKYTAAVPRTDGMIASKTPSWLNRAVYVEEEEEETADTVQAETKDVSSKKPWTMKRPCRTAPSFTTFSKFCKTAPNPPTSIMSSTHNQKSLRTSTTPTSSRSIVQSAPPHNKTCARIREIPHSWPSPKRLRLEEERDEYPTENGMKGTSSAIGELEGEIEEPRAPLESDVKSYPVQDMSSNLDKVATDQRGHDDFQDKLNSKGDFHQSHSQWQNTANKVTPNVGFSSASGKAIFVSSEALRKAERLLEDVDREKPPEEFQLNLSAEDEQCGFQSASGKFIAISEAALAKASKIIAEVNSHEEEETHISNMKQPTSLGFTSAKGSVIKVSEAAMTKARKMMNDINQEEESNATLQECRLGQTSGNDSVDGGGDGSRIHNGDVRHKVSLPGNALPDKRQRHKGFRPFKPPCLVAKVQTPSLSSPTSISSINQNSAIDVVNGSEREERFETYRVSIPDDLQTSIRQGNVVMPMLQITKVEHNQKKTETSESGIVYEQTQDKQKFTDNSNGQPIDDSDFDISISEDDCLSATQAAREIKAAEEMELVYNFMQEEDTGFSQLDVSSIEKGAAKIFRCIDKQKHQMQKEERCTRTSIHHQQQEIGKECVPSPEGEIVKPITGNEELPASNLDKDSQLHVDPGRHYLKRAGEGHAHEADASTRVADLSLNTVRQLMDDSSILIEVPGGVGNDLAIPIGEYEEQREEPSNVESHTATTAVADVDCTDKSTVHGTSEAIIQCNPSLSTKTECFLANHLHVHQNRSELERDSLPEQNKQAKMLPKDKPVAGMENNLEAHSSIGFKTAGGKKIQVSESALQKASLLLSDCNSDVERIGECSKKVSNEILNQSVPRLSAPDKCIPDATSREENMELCKSVDQKYAKASECTSSDNVSKGAEIKTGNDSGCPASDRNSSLSSGEHLPSCVSRALSDLCHVGFQTAGGTDIKISESALQRAKLSIGENNEDHFDKEKHIDYSLDSRSAACLPGTKQDVVHVGFQTAGGSKAHVPRSALQRAKKMLETETEPTPDSDSRESPIYHPNKPNATCDMDKHHKTLVQQKSLLVTSNGLCPKAVGFQTASGNSVTVSEDSLSRSRQLFAECEAEYATSLNREIGLPATNIPKTVGFQTASGSKITVSDVALQKARRLISDENKSSDEEAIGNVKDSFSEQGSSMVRFQTACGNSIEISQASLMKARQLLANDDTDSCDTRNSHTDQLDISGRVTASNISSNMKSEIPSPKARQVKPRHEDSFDYSSGHMGSMDTKHSAQKQSGFQTARGGDISVSDESLRKAKQLLACDTPDGNIQEEQDLGKQTVAESNPPMTGFQTGRGKHINISESAIQAAKQLLSTDFNNPEDLLSPVVECSTAPNQKHPGRMQVKVGFQTGGGRRVEISESSLLKVRHTFSHERDANQNVLKSEPSGPRKEDNLEPVDMDAARLPGFQTGGGKRVEISAESLQHARNLLGSDYEEADRVAQSPADRELWDQNLTMGFQTGRGKKVQISEASLQKARQFLSDETDAPPATVGFQTGHGKKVQTSEASLQKARQSLADGTDNPPVAVGFQTGCGKKVQISEASLQKAKQFLDDGADNPPVAVGFQTGHGKNVQISEASLQKAKQFLDDGADNPPVAVGFQTGCGKKVQTSEASLQKARQSLADGTDNPPVAVGFQTGCGKKVQISEASLQKAKQFLDDGADNPPVAVGFQTGHGKNVQISEASLQGAKQFLADGTDAPSVAVGFQTGHGKKVKISVESLQKAKQFLANETVAPPVAVGFQTGHGKKVKISEEFLQKAKQFLADGNETPPNQNIALGFQTGNGKAVQISKESMEKARHFLADESDLVPDQNKAVGFQTGHGKKVQISETSLQKARQFLADSDAGTDPYSNHSAIVAEATEQPPSWKPSKMAGFMTGDGRKVQVSEASLQQAKNLLGSQAITDHVSKEPTSGKQLHGDQQQTLISKAVDDHPSSQSNDLKEERFQQERTGVSPGGKHSLATTSNLLPKRSETGGLAKRESLDMGSRQSNQQRNVSRGSRGTGQKPYKPPRRIQDKGSPSDRGLVPRHSNPTGMTRPHRLKIVLKDRSKQLQALQSSPPTMQSTSSLCVSDVSRQHAGPVVKPFKDQNATNQSQSQPEATPPPAEGACSFVARWAEARRAQLLRIDGKKNKVIKPQLGSLWRSRKQEDRTSLRDFVDHHHPSSMSDSELFGHGILSSTLSVRPSNAEEYEFAGEDHFSPSCLESDQGIPLADGGRLVLSPNGLAGKKEFYSALLDTPGVDPKLLKEEWVFNHYKWIIWKAAAMEVAYPLQLGGRFLTPNWVLLQLKYRYDREIDHSQRPAVRKILERDDAASRRMVLCVAAIQSAGSSGGQDGKSAEQRKSLQTIPHPTLELTDGWYSIPVAIDPPLANYVRSGKIQCGTKLCIYGAELIGSQDACSPLEIPEGLKLKITANSTRRARYDARLGLQPDPRPFPLPAISLHPDGGTVGCVDILVLRTYPMQFMEKLPEGGSVFRNAKEEAKAAAMHASQKQNKMEQLFIKIQKQFEAKQAGKGQGSRMKRSLSSSRGRIGSGIEELQSGEELFEAMEAAIDPAAFESILSEHQRSTLHSYQRSRNEMKQADMQTAFNQALAQQNKEGKFERTVVPLLKVRVADYKASTTKWQQTTFLTIWRPTDDLVSQLVEGKRLRISSLATSSGRNIPGMGPVQLASSRTTRYEELPTTSHILQKSYIARAAASMQWLGRGYTQAAYGELDAVGVVVSSEEPKHQPGSSQCHAVYLADQDAAILAIKLWTSPAALHLDDMLKVGSFVSVSNLQYRSSSSSTQLAVALPTAMASDYTMYTPNPKAGYLRAALNQLKAGIKDVPQFVKMMQRRVQSLKDALYQPAHPGSTPRNHPYTARRDRIATPLAGLSRTRSGIQSSPPTSATPQGQAYQLMTVRSCPKNFLKTTQPPSVASRDGTLNPRVQVAGCTPSHLPPGAPRGSTTPNPGTPCQSLMSAMSEVDISPRVIAQHIEQERRSHLLSRIPSPPPLSPLPCPASAPVLRRGFKMPSPIVRGSQKVDGGKSLRKRLRDELEEQDERDSGQLSKHQSDVACDDSDNTNKKQKVENNIDTPQKGVKSRAEGHPGLKQNTKEDDEGNEDDFGDVLGLSASGLRELEMSWSQSESFPEPSAGDQALTTNVCGAEKSSPSMSKDSLHDDDDKHAIPAEVSLENGNHHCSELQDENYVALAIEEAREGTVQACKDIVSVHERKNDAVPFAEPEQTEDSADQSYDKHSGVNCNGSTNQIMETVLEKSTKTSDRKIDSPAQTGETVENESILASTLQHETTDAGEENGSAVTKNIKHVADASDQGKANLQDLENIEETNAAKNNLNSQVSVSCNQNDYTKENSFQENSESQQSRGDDSFQSTTSLDGSQDSSKGNKRKRLSRRGRKLLPEADAVIEILENYSSPLLKRSSRLRHQEKKSYKL